MKPAWLRILPAPLRRRLEGRLHLQRILANISPVTLTCSRT